MYKIIYANVLLSVNILSNLQLSRTDSCKLTNKVDSLVYQHEKKC